MNNPPKQTLRRRKNSSRNSHYQDLEPRRLLAAATIGGDQFGTSNEDAVAITGQLTVSDPDGAAEEAFQAVQILSTDALSSDSVGEFALETNGDWTFTLLPGAQKLREGEVMPFEFTVETVDGTTSTVNIEITGVNDASVISGPLTASFTEDGADVPNFAFADALEIVSVTDADFGEEQSFVLSQETTTYLEFAIVPRELLEDDIVAEFFPDGFDGDAYWGAGLLDSAPALAPGEVVTELFAIETTDGTTATISVEIISVTDVSTFGGDTTGTTDEDSTAPVSGTLLVSVGDDLLENGVVPIGSAAGDYGAFSIDASGDWTFVVDNAAVQFLNDNDSVTDSFVVESIDGTATEVVTVTITGSDDEIQNPSIYVDNGVLTITGTDDADQVGVCVDDNGMIAVSGSLGTAVFDAADVDSVFIEMGDGDDHVSLCDDVTVAAIIDGGDGNDCIVGGGGDDTIRGGDGNDSLHGGEGNDILVGGAGYDRLRGNQGRDILLGGDQSDRLVGGYGDDIMVGGLTNFDNDDATLELIRTEWTRTDISAYQRAWNLYHGQGTLDGTGFRVRSGESIFNDGDRDRLNWCDPGLDWYL